MATLNWNFIKFILGMEGGYADHPADRGGKTNKGIIWDTFENLAKPVLGIEPTMANFLKLTDAQAALIIRYFWNQCKANSINSQEVAEMIVDWYWGSGIYAIKRVQKVLNNSFRFNLDPDGKLGRNTLAAINSVPAYTLLKKLYEERKQHYNDIVKNDLSQMVFLNGWIRRVSELYEKKKKSLLLAESVH